MQKILLFIFFITSLFAHPHTFIDVYPLISVSDKSIQKLHFTWKIDEMTSSMLLMELDQNGDGRIDAKENILAYKNYFLVFKDYDYYTFIKHNGKTIPFPQPKNFQASIENHRVCYSFDIELKQNIEKTLIEFGDTDFYVAMVLKQEFITITGAEAVASGVDNDFYYGYRLEMK